ncbi:hypothetical protein Lser_V15G43209 [Lactuca serriola]
MEKKTIEIKFFILLLVLAVAVTLASATNGLVPNWDGRKFCSTMVCKMGTGDAFCTEDCIPRGWTNGQCDHLPGITGDTGNCCCWTL